MSLIAAEWGLRGVEHLRRSASVIVIVDVLSFSTCVDVAVSRGADIYPVADGDIAVARNAARKVGAILAERKRGGHGQYSLSPASLTDIPVGTKLILPSPNGSALSAACGATPVLTGCLRNAETVALAARDIACGGEIGVVPAGERWPDGSLRPAIEDLMGAGAVIRALDLPCTAEAQAMMNAYCALKDDIAGLVWNCLSGQELRERGFSNDIDLAVQQNSSSCAPYLENGAFRAYAQVERPD